MTSCGISKGPRVGFEELQACFEGDVILVDVGVKRSGIDD